jgi:hypothetical protein
MPSSASNLVLLSALATVGHGQFLHTTFGGIHSFGDSFSKSWSYFRGSDGHIQKEVQSTEFRDGHVQKQVQKTDITQGEYGMKRKDTKLVCRDGRCEEIVDEFQGPVMPCHKSGNFLAPRSSEHSPEEAAFHSHLNALLQHLMGRGSQEIRMAHPDTQPMMLQPGRIIVKIPMRENQVPVYTDAKPVGPWHPPQTRSAESVEGIPRMWKLGAIACGAMLLLSLLLLAARCRQSDVSAREVNLQGLAAPLAPGEEAEAGLPAKTVVKDVASVKAAVSKYLPQLYEYAQVKAAVSIYLPRVYARATA